MNVSTIPDVMLARGKSGLTQIELDLTQLAAGSLPLYAVRSCLWACAEGGLVSIYAGRTVDSVSPIAGKQTFQFLAQLIAMGAQELGQITEMDVKRRTIRIVRTQPPVPTGPWSAGIIYSGLPKERLLLEKCISSLSSQPEIANGGELVVCGPSEAKRAVIRIADVRYAAFDTPIEAGRFLVGRKKNHLMAQLKHQRMVVCHTRIALRPGCLAAMPSEFDVITPRVWVEGSGQDLPYIDLGFNHFETVALQSRFMSPSVLYDRNRWMSYLDRFYPYIDGGLYFTMRGLINEIPLSESVAWGEGEDVEWARRIIQSGRLLELSLSANADSNVSKMPRYSKAGHLNSYRAISSGRRSAVNLIKRMMSIF